jgi:hypothetical protein
MLLEPDQRIHTEADERVRLGVLSGQPNSVVLVAEDNHILIGHVEAASGTFRRNQRNGPVPPILNALGTSGPPLRAAILDRYRKAS